MPAGWLGSHDGAQHVPLYEISPSPQHTLPLHVVPPAQQLSVFPHPSECPQPALPKSEHVLGTHATQVSFVHTSLDGHLLQTALTPHPRSTGAHPMTVPASIASAHVRGVQHPPSSQTSVVPHVPQVAAGPHPLLTWPHVRAPHVGGVHAVHLPAVHSVFPAHFDGQATLPLPHALATLPHDSPPSADVHSGGSGAQAPPMHDCPAGHEHAIV